MNSTPADELTRAYARLMNASRIALQVCRRVQMLLKNAMDDRMLEELQAAMLDVNEKQRDAAEAMLRHHATMTRQAAEATMRLHEERKLPADVEPAHDR